MFSKQIISNISDSIDVKNKLISCDESLNLISDISQSCINSLKDGNKIIFCGNGGSFGDSQHLSAELTGKYAFDRQPLASVALGTNNSSISAIGNDYGYEFVFSRELEAIGKKGDVLIAISTSGKSINVIKAIEKSKEIGILSYALLGNDGGEIKNITTSLIIPTNVTARIQESHIMVGQIICGIIEAELGIRIK
tara:strand:- start:8118 stop:8702 length:585 start_codon:yes stop_codon:yes gene_type:complete